MVELTSNKEMKHHAVHHAAILYSIPILLRLLSYSVSQRLDVLAIS